MKHFFSEIPLSAEQLLRKSYKIRLTRVKVRKLEKKNEMYVKSLRHQSYDRNALKKSESCESLNLKVSRSFSGPIIPVSDQTDLKAERRRSFQSVTTLPFSSNPSMILDLTQVCNIMLYLLFFSIKKKTYPKYFMLPPVEKNLFLDSNSYIFAYSKITLFFYGKWFNYDNAIQSYRWSRTNFIRFKNN